jgi:hypothetical protein
VLCVLVGITGMLLCGLLHPTQTDAATGINQEMSFEGKIVTSSGQNIPDGTYSMEFRIYTGCTNEPASSTGCTAVWTEDYLNNNSQGITFTSGTYQVNLGSICAFTTSTCENNSNTAVNWNSYPLYLSLQIGNTSNCSANNPGSSLFTADCGGDGVMNPFILLNSTPYSFNSNELGGLTASQFGQIAANNTWTGSNTIQSTSTTAFQVQTASATILTVDTTDSAVGINTTPSSTYALSVTGAASVASTSALQTAGSLLNVSDTVTLATSGGSFSGQLVNVSRNLTANVTGSGSSTPTFDNGATSGASTTGNYSFSFSVSSGHSNNYLLVSMLDDTFCSGATLGSSGTPTVTYNGAAMTEIGSSQFGDFTDNPGSNCYYLFGLANPTAGSHTLAVTGNSASRWDVGINNWYNVNQSTPYGTFVSAFGTTGTKTTGSHTWPSGHVLVDNAVIYDPSCNAAPGSGQTEAVYGCFDIDGSGDDGGVDSSYKTSTGSATSMSWTGGSSEWATGVVDLIGASNTTESVTDAVATFSNNCAITAGTCADASNIMLLQQQYSSATGAVLDIQNAGTGSALQVQDNSGNTYFAVNTSGATITVSGTASTFATLLISNAHFASTQSTAPTIAKTTCTGGTAAMTAGSTDSAGSFTTGAITVSGKCVITVTFQKAYSSAPKSVVITPANTTSAANAGQAYVSSTSTTTFVVSFNAASTGTYNYYYWVIQ